MQQIGDMMMLIHCHFIGDIIGISIRDDEFSERQRPLFS